MNYNFRLSLKYCSRIAILEAKFNALMLKRLGESLSFHRSKRLCTIDKSSYPYLPKIAFSCGDRAKQVNPHY